MKKHRVINIGKWRFSWVLGGFKVGWHKQESSAGVISLGFILITYLKRY